MFCFNTNLYIPGRPSKSDTEYYADSCLSLSRTLTTQPNVEWIRNGDEWDSRYSKMGCLTEIFDRLEDYENDSDYQGMCGVYLLAVGAADSLSHIAAIPLNLIGTYIKNYALEIDPEAKAYNQKAKEYIQFCSQNAVTQDEIEKLKQKCNLLKFQIELYQQVLKITESQPKEEVFFKFNNDTYLIHPIQDRECIVDYEIDFAFQQIKWLPIKLSALFDLTQRNESRLYSLELEIKIKEQQLELIEHVKKDFERQALGDQSQL